MPLNFLFQDNLIRFIYTNSVENSSITPELLKAADKYQVSRLLGKCCHHLARNISAANVVEYFLLGYFVTAASLLKTTAMIFFIDNFEEVKETTPDQLHMLFEEHPNAFQEIFEFENKRYIKKNL